MITKNKTYRLLKIMENKTRKKTYRLILGSIFVTKTKTRNKTSHSHSINTYAKCIFLIEFVRMFLVMPIHGLGEV